jgi:hypothetical protein
MLHVDSPQGRKHVLFLSHKQWSHVSGCIPCHRFCIRRTDHDRCDEKAIVVSEDFVRQTSAGMKADIEGSCGPVQRECFVANLTAHKKKRRGAAESCWSFPELYTYRRRGERVLVYGIAEFSRQAEKGRVARILLGAGDD